MSVALRRGRLARRVLAAFASFVLFIVPGSSLAQGFTVSGRTDYPAGSGLEWVAVADLDNDGHKDLVTANYFGNNISVLRGSGGGAFLPPTTYTAGAGPFTVNVVDLNNDIQADLLVANYAAGTISVLLGNGSGAFGTKTDYVSGANTAVARAGDFNQDGKMDVVTVNYGAHTASIFLGDGAGGFAPRVDYPTGANPNWVSFLDLDFDGKLDLVTANFGASTISILRGRGDGTFHPKVDSPVGAGPLTLKLADFNLDGIWDVATANYLANTVSVRMGNGSGGFGPSVDYPTGVGPVTIDVGDLDLDSRVDVAVCNESGNSVSVLLGDGLGGLGAKTDYATGTSPYAVVITDVTGDGEPDLVTGNFGSGDVSVLRGDVPGGFRVGSSAAALGAPDQHGVTRTLAGYTGKWIVLDLCTVWCPPCNAIAQEAQQVHDSWVGHPTVSVEYVTALIDGPNPWVGATLRDAQNWAHRFSISRPVLHAEGLPRSPSRTWFDAVGSNAFPTLVFIDPGGVIRDIYIGSLSGQETVNHIAALAGVPAPALAGTPPPVPPPPPPPPVPGAPPPQLFYAMQSATLEVTYNGVTWTGPLSQQSDPNTGVSYLYAGDVSGVPGIPNAAWLGLHARVNPASATETVSIFVGTLSEQDSIALDHPWKVRLTNIVWPDGYARAISQANSPVVGAFYWDAGTQSSPYFQTPIQPAVSTPGFGIEMSTLPIGNTANLPNLVNGFVVDGIVLQHVGPVAVEEVPDVPRLALSAPYPNPATRTTTIRWTMPRAGEAVLDVFDVAGRRVRRLQAGPATAGEHASAWDLLDGSGVRVTPGVFFLRFASGGQTRSARMVVLD